MIDRVGKECCGCSACEQSCPKHCIRMAVNREGFLYPQIQWADCVHCNLCETVCPVLRETIPGRGDLREAWAVVQQDPCILKSSSSGGLFTALADTVMEKGGCVFGAAFTGDFGSVQHRMAQTPEEVCSLRDSKYMQSDTADCYPAVKEQLDLGRWVLFTGTPCQIAGLTGYLGRDYDRLICADVICHGAPSALLWQQYLHNVEENLCGKAAAVNHRDKTEGWSRYGMDITAENGKTYHGSLKEDPYLRMFLKNVSLRESCYHCRIKEKGSPSDITMGDFWHVEEFLPKLDSGMGVSLALVHTEKGRVLFEQAGGRMEVIPVEYPGPLRYNPSLTNSAVRPRQRDRFYADLKRLGWMKMEKRYLKDHWWNAVRRKLSASPVGAVKRRFIRSIHA